MADPHDHVLRSEVALLFFVLLFLVGLGLLIYGVGFEVRDWGLARISCGRADGAIRLYTGRVVQRPGDGVLSAAEPGFREQHGWDAGRLFFVTNDQGETFAVRSGPWVPEGARISFCGVDHGVAALWSKVGHRSGPGFGLQPVWGKPEGSYHRVRWIDGTVLY